MNIRRLLESFNGSEQLNGWVDRRSGDTISDANVGDDALGAAATILELTPAQRRQLERDGEITLDSYGGGVTYISL